jgi:predicted lipid-binding transport protein (Tim44 family)
MTMTRMPAPPPERPPNEPRPHRMRLPIYMAIGALEGAMAGWVALGVLMALDIQGIATLVRGTESGFLMFQLAVLMFAITFGMLGIAWRVMVLLPDEKP